LAALFLSTSSSSINAQSSSVEPVAPHRIASHAHQDSRRPIASVGPCPSIPHSPFPNPDSRSSILNAPTPILDSSGNRDRVELWYSVFWILDCGFLWLPLAAVQNSAAIFLRGSFSTFSTALAIYIRYTRYPIRRQIRFGSYAVSSGDDQFGSLFCEPKTLE